MSDRSKSPRSNINTESKFSVEDIRLQIKQPVNVKQAVKVKDNFQTVPNKVIIRPETAIHG